MGEMGINENKIFSHKGEIPVLQNVRISATYNECM